MPLVGTRGGASARAYGFTSYVAPEVLGGMVLVAPTSVDKTGTGSSATINSNGSITFSACTALSLNGVFTSSYDNYMIALRMKNSSAQGIDARLRASGTDNSTASSYVRQTLEASSTTVSGARTTADYARIGASDTTEGGYSIYVFGPQLAQPTAWRSVGIWAATGATLTDYAGTHNQSTSYDGITIFPFSGDFTGLVSVYGLVGA